MVIRILDIVAACNTASEGAAVAAVVRAHLEAGETIKLSFAGVSDVPSSFVNASIVHLFNEMNDTNLSERLRISDVTSQIAEMIRRCLANSQRDPRAA